MGGPASGLESEGLSSIPPGQGVDPVPRGAGGAPSECGVLSPRGQMATSRACSQGPCS